jgi:hypothetical protein
MTLFEIEFIPTTSVATTIALLLINQDISEKQVPGGRKTDD